MYNACLVVNIDPSSHMMVLYVDCWTLNHPKHETSNQERIAGFFNDVKLFMYQINANELNSLFTLLSLFTLDSAHENFDL